MLTRATVDRSFTVLADLCVMVLLAAGLFGVLQVAKHWEAPLQPRVDINLSIWALPGYTALSLLRGFTAYGLSLAFALTYGYVAAHRPRAERFMLPLLDILQSIPVLGFLPGIVLALVALFPQTNVGLEVASIVMIFTGQVWNLAFSFYQSLRSIPAELREASALYQFNWWQRFRRVELPASAIGLAWNSMMAMAGGWFFLMVCEAFTLGTYDFRLPGLGAYMSVAIAQHQVSAIAAGIVAMVLMIVVVDMCVWKPVLVWAQKFRLEDVAATELQGGSFILRWFQRSWLVQEARARFAHPVSEWLASRALQSHGQPTAPASHSAKQFVGRGVLVVASFAGGVVTVWAAGRLLHLFSHLPSLEWLHVITGAVLTLLRVLASVVLGSLWTVPVGILIGRSDRWCQRLQPLVQVAASFPAPMVYPLVLLALHWLGVDLGIGATVLMAIGTQWYILFNVLAGVSAVPQDLREVAQSYQFTSMQRWRTVWWPAMFPYLITGWITASGGAWNASIVAEYVSAGHQVTMTHGLGSLISVAASQGKYDLLAASVLVMTVAVLLLNRYLWKPLYRLAETRYAF